MMNEDGTGAILRYNSAQVFRDCPDSFIPGDTREPAFPPAPDPFHWVRKPVRIEKPVRYRPAFEASTQLWTLNRIGMIVRGYPQDPLTFDMRFQMASASAIVVAHDRNDSWRFV
jgi:hypothetical protein